MADFIKYIFLCLVTGINFGIWLNSVAAGLFMVTFIATISFIGFTMVEIITRKIDDVQVQQLS